MSKFNFIKKASYAFASVAMAAGIFFSAGVAHATIPYNGENTPPSPTPAFNVFTSVPQGVGDEPDFLRARVPVATPDTSTQYVDPLNATCVAGQKIQMRVYVHNGTSVSTNLDGTGPGVAHGTTVKVVLPTGEASTFSPSATISATNVPSVNDSVSINCNGKVVKLKYVAGSASQSSITTGKVALADTIVTTGVPISSHGVSGDVWACWDERVYVLLTVEVEEVKPPVVPVISCDELKVSKTSLAVNEKFTTTTTITAKNGASFKKAIYTFGDENSDADKTTVSTLTNGKIVAEHSYAKAGTYTISSRIDFDVNGSPESVTDSKCTAKVTVTAPPQAVLAATTTTLPATGAGSVIGIFTGTSILGAFLYRMRALRINR